MREPSPCDRLEPSRSPLNHSFRVAQDNFFLEPQWIRSCHLTQVLRNFMLFSHSRSAAGSGIDGRGGTSTEGNTNMTRFRSFACLILLIAATAVSSWGQVVISVRFGPPVLPVYAQPLCPGPGYIWTPGYWAWGPDDDGYYWVPGTWVIAPQPGFLWTPGYWGFGGGAVPLARWLLGTRGRILRWHQLRIRLPRFGILRRLLARSRLLLQPRRQQRKRE